MEEVQAQSDADDTWKLAVKPSDYASSAEEIVAREQIVANANFTNHEEAMRSVQKDYQNYKETRNEGQRKVMPDMPPAKYIAQHYFKALEQSVNKCSGSRLAHEEGNGSTASVEETKKDTSKKENWTPLPVQTLLHNKTFLHNNRA